MLVGHTTLIEGNGKLVVGKGPVRTGVTAVLPRGAASMQQFSFAGWFSENGNGEMTGTTWVEESGFLEGPVLITNTHSVGVVRDAVIAWRVAHGPADATDVLVVAAGGRRDLGRLAERHQRLSREARARLSRARQRALRGGRGRRRSAAAPAWSATASRAASAPPRAGSADKDGGYLLGVLVQCNYGTRQNLRIAGIPVGREITSEDPYASMPSELAERGSIIVVVATDAPLLPHQLKRIARRVTLGIGRNGSIAGNGSGDIFIAFSTANPHASELGHVVELKMVPNDSLDPLFAATVQATEEAIVNAMVAARDMTGIDGHHVRALPHDRAARRAREVQPAQPLRPSGPHDQQQPRRDDDGADGARDARTRRCQTLDGDGGRHERHGAQVHDPDDQQDRRRAGTAVTAVHTESQAVTQAVAPRRALPASGGGDPVPPGNRPVAVPSTR